MGLGQLIGSHAESLVATTVIGKACHTKFSHPLHKHMQQVIHCYSRETDHDEIKKKL